MDKHGGTFGGFEVVGKRLGGGLTSETKWYVSDGEEKVSTHTEEHGERRAQTLAAMLDAADADSLDMLPPDRLDAGALRLSSDDDVEAWAGEQRVVPAAVAGAGKAPLAAWLKIVHRRNDLWIADTLGIEEGSVTQYLSDLRAGRR